MITRRFIEKIRFYFNELNIKSTQPITYEDFERQAIKILNRCDTLFDAKKAIVVYKYCVKHWKKIEKIFSKHLNKWQDLTFEKPACIKTISAKDAEGTYCITNAFTKSKDIYITSKSYNDELYMFQHKNGKFKLNDDDNYYMRFSKLASDTMKLFDKNNKLLCNIVLDNNYDIFLKANASKYELVPNREDEENPFIGVFEKSYIDSLGENDYIEFKNMIATLEWDIVDKKRSLGVARITLYKNIEDCDFLPVIYFGASTFLTYKYFKDTMNAVILSQIANG